MRWLVYISVLLLIPFIGKSQKVKWENTTVNFGTVRDWNSPPATFTFQNTGNEKLMFLPQRHERDVLVRYPNRSIRSGETGTITILYYTGEKGSFSRTVEVYTSASNRPEKLTVKGNIKSIYADALTSCPSFHTQQPAKTGEPNVIQVVDAKTDRPIPGAQVEVFDRGIRKAINGTNLEGVAVNWIESGKYIAVAYKEGYDKGEDEVSFTKRNRTHIIYLNRKEEPLVVDGGRLTVEGNPVVLEDTKVNDVQAEIDTLTALSTSLGITTNEVLEEGGRQSLIDNRSSKIKEEELDDFDLGISTNEQWETPIETSEEEEQVEEDFDLGIALNEQIAEEPEQRVDNEEEIDTSTTLSTSLGITTNEVLADEEPQPERVPEVSVEEMVEAALAQSGVEAVAENPEKVEVSEPEPEFSANRYKPNNVLLLLDVSGSMDDDGKMDRLKSSIRRLVMMLREVDVLTMIAYNSSSWELLPPTPVTQNEAIVALVDSLEPTGYTNGVKGMESAYQSLEQQLIEGGNNQLIIATDGKFNSSKFSEKEAIQLVKDNSSKGVVLSIIGFGEDKEAQRLMKRLAKLGEGSFLQVSSGQDPTDLLADEIKLRSQK